MPTGRQRRCLRFGCAKLIELILATKKSSWKHANDFVKICNSIPLGL